MKHFKSMSFISERVASNLKKTVEKCVAFFLFNDCLLSSEKVR
jgi:hypothetical protein